MSFCFIRYATGHFGIPQAGRFRMEASTRDSSVTRWSCFRPQSGQSWRSWPLIREGWSTFPGWKVKCLNGEFPILEAHPEHGVDEALGTEFDFEHVILLRE
ncbi:uncharacterized protein LOC128093275 [Culex pipiens pallens]|uniref:uncharacterized protein LOC128093275 n=1 Tax=Culex pipiens pallens TaxID=42434 RepID=UPI0022AAD7C7|nr:uncharacterized protein LOC128093275 [Culex pipiens pallens]